MRAASRCLVVQLTFAAAVNKPALVASRHQQTSSTLPHPTRYKDTLLQNLENDQTTLEITAHK